MGNLDALRLQVEQEMQRQAILALVILAVLVALMFWLLYITIKAAIRDGIKESGLVPTWAESVRRAQESGWRTPPAGSREPPDSERDAV